MLHKGVNEFGESVNWFGPATKHILKTLQTKFSRLYRLITYSRIRSEVASETCIYPQWWPTKVDPLKQFDCVMLVVAAQLSAETSGASASSRLATSATI